MLHGTTFSHRQIQHLGLDVNEAFDFTLDFNFDFIRLGAYWDEIEKKTGEYDFTILDELSEKLEMRRQKCILTVGVKAPRYPEFYWPAFLKQKEINNKKKALLQFIKVVVNRYKDYPCISHWQVENEPLDDVEGQSISLELLNKEVELVRSLDNRPIIINLWGNALSHRGFLPQVEPLADVIGVDLYYKQFMTKKLTRSWYIGPMDNDEKLTQMFTDCSKPIWITELQAEPWEDSDETYRSENTKSMSPEKLIKFYERAKKLPVEAILFWGVEYWYYRYVGGDLRYKEAVEEVLGR